MAITDIFIPGRIKANLAAELSLVKAMAVQQSQVAGLSAQRSAIWEACCNGAEDLVAQLFIANRDKHLDWGLKKHRRKLDRTRMSAVYWWMLLYQLVLLRNRGLDGHDKDEEFASLSQVAHEFMETLASSPDSPAINPGPWEERWDRQVSLEAALGLYNILMQVFRLHVDFEVRIARVSLFTSATENAYDTNIRASLS